MDSGTPFGHAVAMAKPPKKNDKAPAALMVGIGLDSDGHKRLTTGKNFALVGGSKETHEEMTEKAVKINEKLAKRGKELHEVSRQEFDDIAHEVGLRRNAPERN
jgi:tyrosyl-tRNA synthetase